MITPTFGTILKGYRLGFGWSREHQCFIRLCEVGNLYCVELAPGDQGARGIPNKTASKEHRCWWDTGSKGIIEMIEPLKQIKAVKKYTRIYLDEQGRQVTR